MCLAKAGNEHFEFKVIFVLYLFILLFFYSKPAVTANPGTLDANIDIGIFNISCSGFEVRLRPDTDINSYLSNLQFTIKWPANTAGLINFNADFGLAQQGPVFVSGGFNYAVFVAVPGSNIAINWLAGEEYAVMTFEQDQSVTGTIDIFIAQDSWAANNNGLYYVEMLGTDNTGAVYHEVQGAYTGPCTNIDIGLFNTDCAGFEVRLKPEMDINSYLSNLQFTIKWPENTVEMINFSSDFELTQQGPVFVSGGFNYAVFVAVPGSNMAINWLADEEYTVLTFEHDESGTGTIDIFIAQDAWATSNNGLYYVEMLGTDYTGVVYHEVQGAFAGPCSYIDIGLFNTDCAVFEVKLRPDADIDSYLSNLQFTIKWPENTVEMINFTSDFELTQQGPVFVSGGFKYAVFVAVPATNLAINWLAGEEYTVLTFEHDQSGNDTIDVFVAQDAWATQNNGLYYVELLGTDYTGIIYHEALNVPAGPCNYAAYIKVILQGAYEPATEEMRTSINAAGNLPLLQPYNTPPWNYSGTESVVSLPDSIVDWVLVELRDQNDASLLIERRAALLSKSGLVLETDLSFGVEFTGSPGNYFLVVDHRNHMPAMTGNTVTLPNDDEPYDFREIVITQPYLHNNPRQTVLELDPPGSGKYGIIAGDVNADKVLLYLGPNNDRGQILSIIINVSGSSLINGSILGYYNEDVTLDNKVLYLGTSDDRGIIYQNLIKLTGSNLINSVYYSVVP
jgi:hypothetical protein